MEEDSNILSTVIGIPRFMAPEMLKGLDSVGAGVTYGKEVDIYSLSILLFQLFTDGDFPFVQTDILIQLMPELRRNPEIPSTIPLLLKPVLQKGFSFEPSERPELDTFRSTLRVCDIFDI
jgi:serine/threonine protein kinase